MSQFIADLSNPAVAEMVGQWEEGGTYRIEMVVTQGPTKGSLVSFDVTEITDYGDAAESSDEAPIEPAPLEDAGGMVGNRAQIEKIPVAGAG